MSIEIIKANHRLFQKNISSDIKEIYSKVASKQNPAAIIITCIDSRILPEQLLGLKPGQIFCLRNVANLVSTNDTAVVSALEFAIVNMKIKHIIVMGHSNCGGINALTCDLAENSLAAWLNPWKDNAQKWLLSHKKNNDLQEHCQKQAVLDSIDNISKLSFIDESVSLHAWHLDLESAAISEFCKKHNEFHSIN